MNGQIITIYCVCADVLRAMGQREDAQYAMTDAEVLTTAVVAALYFGGNFENARALLAAPQYIPTMMGKSRFNGRLIIDSFPIAACDNYRIRRNKLYPQDEAYDGYLASRKRYFFGVRIHLLVTERGQPVEFFLLPGRAAEVSALDCYRFDVREGSTVYADGTYNDCVTESIAQEAQLPLLLQRKNNMHDQFPRW